MTTSEIGSIARALSNCCCAVSRYPTAQKETSRIETGPKPMRHWECAQEFQQSFNIRHLADRCSRSTRVSAGSCRNSHESVVALPWPQITPLNARRLGSYSLGVAAVLLDCSLALGECAAEIRWVSSEQIARALKKQDSSLCSRVGAPVYCH